MLVVKFRARPADPTNPVSAAATMHGHVEVQVFTGHGSQSNPNDITVGLSGTLVMDPADWHALQSRLKQVGPDERYAVTFMEGRA